MMAKVLARAIKRMSDLEAAQLLGMPEDRFPDWTQGLVITDSSFPDNPIVYASPGFAALTGYAVSEIVGRNCRFLQGPGSAPETIAAIRKAVAARQRFDGDILNFRKNGQPFWNHLSIGPLTSAATATLQIGLQFDVSFRHPRVQ
jgi:PAS domain S-box-containing protein